MASFKKTQTNLKSSRVQSWTKGCTQIHKTKQIGLSMECIPGDFFAIFTKKRQNLVFGWPVGHSPLNPSISEIFFIFLIS